jgi:hypothetical protein
MTPALPSAKKTEEAVFKAVELQAKSSYPPVHNGIAALAQVVEHIIRNDGVRCSSHLSGTSFL